MVFLPKQARLIPSIKVGGFCSLLGCSQNGIYLADTLQLHFGGFLLSNIRSWICNYTRFPAQGAYIIEAEILVLFTGLAEFLGFICQKNAPQEKGGREEGAFRAPGEQFKERYRM